MYDANVNESDNNQDQAATDPAPAATLIEFVPTKDHAKRLDLLWAYVRMYLVRGGWAVLSIIIVAASGIFTGLRSFDHVAGARLVRTAIVLVALCCLAAVTCGISHTIEKDPR